MPMNLSAVRGLYERTSKQVDRKWTALSCLPIMVCLLWGMHASLSEKGSTVVTFNQDVINQQFVTQLSQYTLSDEMIRVKTDAFKKAVHEALRDYAAKHHALVMMQKNVVAGGRDATQEIEKLIAIHMRKSS